MTSILRTLPDDLVWRIGWTLLHLLWEGFAIALVVAGVLFALRRAAANVRYGIAVGGLVLIPIAGAVTFTQLHAPVQAQPPRDDAVLFVQSLVTEPAPAFSPPLALANPLPLSPTVEPTEPLPVRVTPRPAPHTATVWKTHALSFINAHLAVFVWVWIAGVALFSIRLLGGWMHVQRLRSRHTSPTDAAFLDMLRTLTRRLHLRRPVLLVQTCAARTPMVIGWLRPIVLLPVTAVTGLTEDQLYAVLAHELAHIRRHDYLVNLVQSVIETVLFYHPVVWWLSRRVRIEREHCCDDVAIACCGDRLLYARALANLESLRATPMLAAAAANGSLLARIRRIVTPSNPPHSASSWQPALVALLLLTAIGAGARLRAQSADAAMHPPTTAPVSGDREDDTQAETSLRTAVEVANGLMRSKVQARALGSQPDSDGALAIAKQQLAFLRQEEEAEEAKREAILAIYTALRSPASRPSLSPEMEMAIRSDPQVAAWESGMESLQKNRDAAAAKSPQDPRELARLDQEIEKQRRRFGEEKERKQQELIDFQMDLAAARYQLADAQVEDMRHKVAVQEVVVRELESAATRPAATSPASAPSTQPTTQEADGISRLRMLRELNRRGVAPEEVSRALVELQSAEVLGNRIRSLNSPLSQPARALAPEPLRPMEPPVGTWHFSNFEGDDEQMAIFPDRRVTVFYSNGHADRTQFNNGRVTLAEYGGSECRLMRLSDDTLLQCSEPAQGFGKIWTRLERGAVAKQLIHLTGPNKGKRLSEGSGESAPAPVDIPATALAVTPRKPTSIEATSGRPAAPASQPQARRSSTLDDPAHEPPPDPGTAKIRIECDFLTPSSTEDREWLRRLRLQESQLEGKSIEVTPEQVQTLQNVSMPTRWVLPELVCFSGKKAQIVVGTHIDVPLAQLEKLERGQTIIPTPLLSLVTDAEPGVGAGNFLCVTPALMDGGLVGMQIDVASARFEPTRRRLYLAHQPVLHISRPGRTCLVRIPFQEYKVVGVTHSPAAERPNESKLVGIARTPGWGGVEHLYVMVTPTIVSPGTPATATKPADSGNAAAEPEMRRPASRPVRVFYILGGVTRPGVYSMVSADLTLKRAIAAAGGIDKRINLRKAWCQITRGNNRIEYRLSPMDLEPILSGKADDVPLRSEDVIHIYDTPKP